MAGFGATIKQQLDKIMAAQGLAGKPPAQGWGAKDLYEPQTNLATKQQPGSPKVGWSPPQTKPDAQGQAMLSGPLPQFGQERPGPLQGLGETPTFEMPDPEKPPKNQTSQEDGKESQIPEQPSNPYIINRDIQGPFLGMTLDDLRANPTPTWSGWGSKTDALRQGAADYAAVPPATALSYGRDAEGNEVAPEEADAAYADQLKLDPYYAAWQAYADANLGDRGIYDFMEKGTADEWAAMLSDPSMMQYYTSYGLYDDAGQLDRAAFDSWYNQNELQNIEEIYNSGGYDELSRLLGGDLGAWSAINQELANLGWGWSEGTEGMDASQIGAMLDYALLGQYLKSLGGNLDLNEASLDEMNYLARAGGFAYGADMPNEFTVDPSFDAYGVNPWDWDAQAYDKWNVPYSGLDSLVQYYYPEATGWGYTDGRKE